ncbi:MAG: hypothetical protein H0X29_05600 [Parachlamydiaceae bacterium]|nr:hypothetical protein [Parachlamydiaceae bacterium]
MNKYFILLALAIAPLMGYADSQAVTQVHKPPILTTTAIIEVHEGGSFKGIVLIERGKSSLWQSYSWGESWIW